MSDYHFTHRLSLFPFTYNLYAWEEKIITLRFLFFTVGIDIYFHNQCEDALPD